MTDCSIWHWLCTIVVAMYLRQVVPLHCRGAANCHAMPTNTKTMDCSGCRLATFVNSLTLPCHCTKQTSMALLSPACCLPLSPHRNCICICISSRCPFLLSWDRYLTNAICSVLRFLLTILDQRSRRIATQHSARYSEPSPSFDITTQP